MPVAVSGTPPRAELRASRVEHGLQELDRWLADQVRTGLAPFPRVGYAHFDAIAARMVDAQAPGVAGMLRALPEELGKEDWPDRILHGLAGLHLLSRAHASIEALPDELAATVRSRIGYPVAKADVLAGPGLFDSWWAVGAVDVADVHLRRRRVWLRGAVTGRWAVWLTFAPTGMPFDDAVLPGQAISGELHFYPGAGQHRALFGQTVDDPIMSLDVPGSSVADVRTEFARLVAADPWATRMPAAMLGCLRHENGGWWLEDATGVGCPLLELEAQPWPLLAQSAGEPLTIFGEWNGFGLWPLSVLPDDQGRILSTEICG